MRSFFEFFSQLPGFIKPKTPSEFVFEGKLSESSPDVSMEKETAGDSKASAKRVRMESDI